MLSTKSLLNKRLLKNPLKKVFPSKQQGNDGDLQLARISGKGEFLLGKIDGNWFSTKLTSIKDSSVNKSKKIKTSKLYGLGGLALTLVSESISTSIYAGKTATSKANSQPILKIGNGKNTGIVSSLGNQDLLLTTGNSTSSYLNITDGSNGSITSVLNGSGKFDVIFNSSDADDPRVRVLNVGSGGSSLDLIVSTSTSDSYIAHGYIADDPSNNRYYVSGIDNTNPNSYNINFTSGSSAGNLTPSNGTNLVKISNDGDMTLLKDLFVTGDATVDGGRLDIDISSGDPKLVFQIGGTSKFTLGLDDSDSDKFKINSGSTIGDSSDLELDSSGNFSVAGTITAAGFTTTGTWTFDDATSGTVGITTVHTGSSFTDNDTSLMTSGAIKEKIEDYGYTTATYSVMASSNSYAAGLVAAGSGTHGSEFLRKDGTWVVPTNTTYSVGDGGLTTNDFTNDDHTKLNGIAAGAEVNVQADWNEASSGSDAFIANKPTIPAAVTNYITNDAADIMSVSDFGAVAAFKIDADQPATTAAEDSKGLWIDYDRIVASSGTNAHNDIGIDLDVNTASLGTSSAIGLDVDIVGATSGAHTSTGMDINVSGSDVNQGLNITVPDATADYHMRLFAADDVNDYATFSVKDTGDLYITTEDSTGGGANIYLDADGDVTLSTDATSGTQGEITLDATLAINLDSAFTGGSQTIFKQGGSTFATISRGNTAAATAFRLYEGANLGSTDDYFEIKALEHAATTISTVDDNAAAGHLTLDIDGDITLDAASGNIYVKDNGGNYTPGSDYEIATKKYVDDNAGGGDMTGVALTGGTGISIDSETNTTSGDYSATITCNVEGTEIASTGEGGGSKFLREDGDGTCSWQTVSGGASALNDLSDVTYSSGDLTISSLDKIISGSLDFDSSGHINFDGCAAGFTRTTYADATNVEVDFTTGNKAHLDMTGGSIAGTLTLKFPAVSGNFVLVVQQDGSARTINAYATKDAAGNAGNNDGGTAGAVRWAGGGTAPDLTDGGNKRDILSFYWDATEEVCYGVASLNF